MKRGIKYRVYSIPGKLSIDIKLSYDTTKGTRAGGMGENTVDVEGNQYTNISLFPFLLISLSRPGEIDENGQRQRPIYVPNDNMSMTRYQIAIFMREISRINELLKVPELYSYLNNRLELNNELAEKSRSKFIIGSMNVELSPVVITQPDDTRVEGIKMKFNVEDSSVLLTLNDLESLIFIISTLDIDNIALQLHRAYSIGTGRPTSGRVSSPIIPSTIDIKSDDTPF